MSGQPTKHGDELLARLVMRAALGVQVEKHDDQSRPGMFDAVVEYQDGRRAAVEVVSTRDQQTLELLAATVKTGYVPCPQLNRMWVLSVQSGTRVGDLKRKAPALLGQLEQNGVAQLRRYWRDPWLPELRALGVVSCRSHAPTVKHPPGFYIIQFPIAAWNAPGDEIVRVCDEFLAVTSDVPAKLLASGLAERHAVLVVTVDWLGIFCSIEDGVLPEAAPTLPQGVDCVWLVLLKSPPIRAIYWLGDGVWREVVLTQEQMNALDQEADQAA